MKLSLISTLLATLALKSVTANPVPEPHPQKFKIGESSLGPVYSNVDPNQHQRRDLSSDISKRNPLPQQRYKIGESELGPVYSTVDPNQHQRRDVDTELVARDSAYTPVTQDEAAQYIKEKQVFSFLTFDLIENRMTNPFVSGIQSDPSHNKRNNLQKRTYADCVRPHFLILFFFSPILSLPHSTIQEQRKRLTLILNTGRLCRSLWIDAAGNFRLERIAASTVVCLPPSSLTRLPPTPLVIHADTHVATAV